MIKEGVAQRDIRYLDLYQRASGLCAEERLRIRGLLPCSGVLLAVADDEANYELEKVAILLLAMVCSMRKEVHLERPPLSRVRRTIDQLTENEACTNFRFHKSDLPKLLTAFDLPKDILRVAGSRFEREGLFLFFLRRMRQEVLSKRVVARGRRPSCSVCPIVSLCCVQNLNGAGSLLTPRLQTIQQVL